MPDSAILCGAAKATLNARPGQWLGGFAWRGSPAEEVLDPPTVRALVLRHEAEWVALACLDLFGLNLLPARNLRQRVAQELGCPEDAVCIVCTRVSSAPASMRIRGMGDRTDPAWMKHVEDRTAQCFREAAAGLKPVTLLQGSQDEQGASMAVSRLVGSEGPVATLSWATGVAPVLGASNNAISADYVGFVNRSVERWGGVSLHLPGPWSPGFDLSKLPFEPRRDGSHEEAAETGNALTERLAKIQLRPADKARCKARGGGISLPVADLPDCRSLDEIESRLEEVSAAGQREPHRAAQWQCLAQATAEWIREARRLSGRQGLDSIDVPLWRALIGGQELFAVPFEVDLPTMRSFFPALVVGCANGGLGPLPSRRSSSGSLEQTDLPPHVLYPDLHAPLHHLAGPLLSYARESLVI